MQHYLAIDIGGTSIKYGIVQADGTLLSTQDIRTPATWDGLLEQVDIIYNETTAEISIAGISFSAPGSVGRKYGMASSDIWARFVMHSGRSAST
ncbi:ROK family protein [Exiguobacterium sp. AM39-5BH]|uniref:ROK family protein n=1 Tax=Exiguobacterium sp. AM39-5BH TaxID=2292355 RepID=UPI000FE273B8|nr:ROK family protein [Exiguobacterium sp. AM39-5BH]RHB50033.1 ROK family protein [Exiguobacterium sp. AM39-5BH]